MIGGVWIVFVHVCYFAPQSMNRSGWVHLEEMCDYRRPVAGAWQAASYCVEGWFISWSECIIWGLGFLSPWFLVDTCGDGLGDRHIIDGLFDIGSHYISVFLKGATLLQSWSVERASSGHTVICFLTSLASFRNGWMCFFHIRLCCCPLLQMSCVGRTSARLTLDLHGWNHQI